MRTIVTIVRRSKSAVMQDLYFNKKNELKTSVTEIECYVCGKGIQDGTSITAKTLNNGMALFCKVHYLL